MSLRYRVLGTPFGDNALFVEVDTGQSVQRLLFDCGDGCLSELSFGEIQSIDGLFFSHLHMDHVGGFDSFFRCTYDRHTKQNQIWGPPETARILQHRFEGFLWNLHDQMSATWLVSEITPEQVQHFRFELQEAFTVRHDEGLDTSTPRLLDWAGFTIEPITMDHRTPSLAYIVREKPRQSIEVSRLGSLGLRPGRWLQQLKEPPGNSESVDIDGVEHALDELRKQLIVETPGDSIGYLTDFLLDESAIEELATKLRGCRTLVCEAQYRHADVDLAEKHFHMTTVRSAKLAAKSGAEELVLFHLSQRYQPSAWNEMLQEAQQVFPQTRFPSHWMSIIDAHAEPGEQ